MSIRRLIGWLLTAAGVAALAVGASGYTRPGIPEEFVEKRADVESRLDSTRAELQKTSLRYQGYEKSTKSLPDSVRMFGGGIVMEEGRSYHKKIFILEARERDIKLELARLGRKETEAREEARRRSLPILGAGLLVAIAGAFTLRRPRS